MSGADIPTVAVTSDGATSEFAIPQLGFGLYRVPNDDAYRITREAIDVGYRHFDGAHIYDNEAEVGRALHDSGVPREELFITSKLWNSDQGRATTEPAFTAALDRLGLDYLDLYLIHWPTPARGLAVETWAALLEIRDSGRARQVGVSNSRPEDLKLIIDQTGHKPPVNQIELHPRLTQRALLEVHAELGIATEAWAPLGGGDYRLDELAPVVAAAAAHDKTVEQVALGWQLQQGHIVFPKSSSRERMLANLDVFDFTLTDDEMAAIAALDQGHRVGPDPNTFN